MRVYLPCTVTRLRAALEAGQVDVPVGYAVTPALREWYVEGDLEQLEYAASVIAARASMRLLGPHEPARRVVLAADVPDAQASPEPGQDRAAVRLAGPVALSQVESALVDDPAAADDVRRGTAALAAADAGDDDAAFTVAAVDDHELGWWAGQELAGLLESLS